MFYIVIQLIKYRCDIRGNIKYNFVEAAYYNMCNYNIQRNTRQLRIIDKKHFMIDNVIGFYPPSKRISDTTNAKTIKN